MEFDPIDIVMHVINIIVLFVILRGLLIKPVRKFMAEREAKFAREREAIDQSRAEADALKTRYEGSLSTAKKTADELVQERLKRAECDAQEILEHAKQDAQHALSKAHDQALAERDELMLQLQEQTAVLAVDLAEHILEREVRAEDNERLINEFFKKVG
ncbi:MAG TPA: ATP synthase F0 subunit B [Feifaniaceae bacterium]|nr:ATP synthase F0 subunit B [Feifaniaceae bacterium]